MPLVYIIIINYKKWNDTVECLASLIRSTYTEFKIVVIDNNSRDDSVSRIIEWSKHAGNVFPKIKVICEDDLEEQQVEPGPGILLIQNKVNKGFAGAINSVLNILRNKDAYIWLLNPDMVVEASTLSALVKFNNGIERKTITGCVVKYQDDQQKIHFYGGGYVNFRSGTVALAGNKKDIIRLDYISGGSLFTYANNYNELGLLPEDYFLYWEETDWCYHAKKCGYALAVCQDAVCFDKVSSTIGKGFLADYYYTRNGLYFLSKYHKESLQTVFFFAFLRMLKRVASAQFSRAGGVFAGVKDFLNNTVHAYK